ncbi:Chromatin structure-remodeling complex protein rsc9 [Ascosphaera aggregata]|nr:Chromatin structure-remodeling complex protein rsc9 [Ascosphaera aggregata]
MPSGLGSGSPPADPRGQVPYNPYLQSRPVTIYSAAVNHSAPTPPVHPLHLPLYYSQTAKANANARDSAAATAGYVVPVHSQLGSSLPFAQVQQFPTGPGPIPAYIPVHHRPREQSQAHRQAPAESDYRASPPNIGISPPANHSSSPSHHQYTAGSRDPVNLQETVFGGGGGAPLNHTYSNMTSYDNSASLGSNSPFLPISTVPVDTPSNKRGRFAHTLAQQRQNEEKHNPFYQPPEFDPLTFSALPEKTPRIYDHCVKGLESGVPTEVEFALHHLVIISDERGDKFRFCDFPGLADSLLEAAWELTYLVHGVSFEISYDPITPDDRRINVIDGCYGTPNLPTRIKALPVDLKEDGLEPVGFGRYARMVSEAALVIHNMSTLEENAIWLADMAVFKDWVIYTLNMPAVAQERYVEIVNNALETAEMVAPFWTFEKNDVLIPGLLECLKSGDRTHVVLALRIFVCWAMDRPDAKKEMCLEQYMTAEILSTLSDILLLEQDRELLSSLLDFFYQYTTVSANVAHIIQLLDSSITTSLIPRLTNLLLFESEPLLDERIDQEEIKAPPPNDIPDIPPSLHAEICRLPEPERCSTWVRTCFTEDENCEITQLALWNAYRSMFAHVNEQPQQPQQTGPMPGVSGSATTSHRSTPQPLAPTLGAADFINTVSTSFPLAEAQVIRGEVAKFIIRGIRPLQNPIDFQAYPYPRCKWQISVASEGTTTTAATVGTGLNTRTATKCETRCCRTFDNNEQLRDHVYEAHLGLARDNEGKWIIGDDMRPQNVCLWDDCTEYRYNPVSAPGQQQQQHRVEAVKTSTLVNHFLTEHMPSPHLRDLSRPPPPIPPRPYLQKKVERVFEYYPTPADKEPLGIAYKALLVMRNVMRNLPPDPPSRGSLASSANRFGEGDSCKGRGSKSRNHQLFFSQRRKLLETADYNLALRKEIFELVNEIRSS